MLMLPLTALIGSYVERKVAAFMQNRLGPNHVGTYGVLQAIADILKLIQKEDIKPQFSDWQWFKIAPVFIFLTVCGAMALIPLGPVWAGISTDLGIFFVLGILALDVVAIIMAGWASGSNFSLFGAARALALLISYELPLILSLLCVVMLFGETDLRLIVQQQAEAGFGSWALIKAPILWPVFIIFFITSLAESNRAPFDMAEAESEIIAGFHTEYTGTRWALIMLAEYGIMLFVSFLGVSLFWGGWAGLFANSTPDAWLALACLLFKTLFWLLTQMFVRWIFPRFRLDQLMRFCWLFLTPASFILLLLVAFWRYFFIP